MRVCTPGQVDGQCSAPRERERERSLLLLLLPATRAPLIHLLSLYLWNSSLRDENRPTHARTNATGTTTPGIIFGETGLNRGPFFAGPPFSLRFLYTGLVHALICRASIFVNHSTLSRLIERNMTISPQSSKSLYLAILSKVFWKTGSGEKDRWRGSGKNKEFTLIRTNTLSLLVESMFRLRLSTIAS